MAIIDVMARILSIVCLANGLAMLLGRAALRQVFRELSEIRALSYVVGSTLVAFGAILTVLSDRPEGVKAWLVAGFGWMNLAEGFFLTVATSSMIGRYMGPMERPAVYYPIAVGYLGFAAALVWL